ncbi:DMT family transporter [Defluviimonas sp. WL0002]|uniref:DMT family transporter n=1 Tax=Albidovulum marisflavi TaxID=2984159 RepID=A0ABT2Z9J0_9RHOB|nr:DMT family transporter [Defluviimonas sp. WL0002]MCV2867793.1 DMT family transporter [Defluviimonas sp. WL0002]
MPLRYWALIVILGMGWGCSFILNAILLREIGPMSVSLGRVALGALGCWIWALATGRQVRLPLATIGGLFALGTVFFAIPFALYPISQQYLASGVAGITNAMTPIMVVIVSQVWPGGERATTAKSLGVLVGFCGIAVLSLPYLRQGSSSEVWAIFVALCAPFCYGIATNMARSYRGIDSTVVAAWSLTGAALIIAPVALAAEGSPRITRVESWAALLFIGLVLTSAAFIALYWLLRQVGPTASSTVTFVAPVSAVILGALVLDEVIQAEHLAGMAAIFLGLLLIDGRLWRRVFPRGAGEIINRKVE